MLGISARSKKIRYKRKIERNAKGKMRVTGVLSPVITVIHHSLNFHHPLLFITKLTSPNSYFFNLAIIDLTVKTKIKNHHNYL
jgi:hypothetical protein